MGYETASISLIGDRQQNQDNVVVSERRNLVLLAVVDGMGGHTLGEQAALVATESLVTNFKARNKPMEDPGDFLRVLIERANDDVVALGAELSVQDKPRATCAVCLVVDDVAWWAHVGDARIYLIRNGRVVDRTRDHSHVEVLLREGLITEEEVHGHPMRHYVESCLGGESALPDLGNPDQHNLEANDIVLACSDGLWSGVTDEVIGESSDGKALADWLDQLSERALFACAPYSDNTTAAALRKA